MGDAIKQYVSDNQNLFQDVQNAFSNGAEIHNKVGDGLYTILYYEKMLTEMCNYLDGYLKYKNDDDDRYRDKVTKSTETFYNKMFMDTETYRTKIDINDFLKVNKAFLECSKRLQDKIQEVESLIDSESRAVVIITDRQFKKIGKVMRDDMQIFLWTKNGKNIDSRIKTAYSDKTSPVMHHV